GILSEVERLPVWVGGSRIGPGDPDLLDPGCWVAQHGRVEGNYSPVVGGDHMRDCRPVRERGGAAGWVGRDKIAVEQPEVHRIEDPARSAGRLVRGNVLRGGEHEPSRSSLARQRVVVVHTPRLNGPEDLGRERDVYAAQ